MADQTPAVPDSPPDTNPPRPLASILHGGFPGEPSLFAELGVFDVDIIKNVTAVLCPTSNVQSIENSFLVGLLLFCAFAGAFLLAGKVRFSAVYVIACFGTVILYLMFNSMTEPGGGAISLVRLFSCLSYAVVSLVTPVLAVSWFNLSPIGTVCVASPFIAWAALSATRCVMSQLKCEEIRILVFVPLFLFYACLMLLPIY
jgi:hypothetical protein